MSIRGGSMKRYFATARLNDGRIMVMNNNYFVAKSMDLAKEKAKKIYSDMEVLNVQRHDSK